MDKFYLLLLLFLIGCGSSTKITFQTEPSRASIFAKPLASNGEFKEIGVTPAVIKADDIDSKTLGAGPLLVEFRKPGYFPKSVIVTEMSSIDLLISTQLKVESGLEEQQSLNWVIDSLFEVENKVKIRDYTGAIKLLNQLKKQVPQVAAIYEFEGGVFYLRREYKKALNSYRLAARYNPRNPENIKMRDMLEERLGIKDSSKIITPELLESENN